MKQDRWLLDLARGQSCVACGIQDGTIVACHYFGPRRHSYGGGMSAKGHPIVAAHLCARCHADMDTNMRDKAKRWDASEIFLHYCALTWIRIADALAKRRAA